MGFFNKNRASEEQDNYESYMTGFRLGFPVDEDEPGAYDIDPNNSEFRRGLVDGVTQNQENKTFLANRPKNRK